MLRFERREANLLTIIDQLWLLYELIEKGQLRGYSLLYHCLEYHLDPEIE